MTVPYWLVDNPQAVGAAQAISEEVAQAVEHLFPPGAFPARGQPVPIHSQLPQAAWDDVDAQGQQFLESFFDRQQAPADTVTREEMQNAVKAAVGSAIKAMSGFVNTAYDVGLLGLEQAIQETVNRIQSETILANDVLDRLTKLEAVQDFVARYVVPSIQAQIDQINARRLTDFQFNSLADRQWATDNIYTPLKENIGQVAGQIPVWSEGAYERANAYTDQQVGHLGANVLTQLVPLAGAVKALETEAEECVKPMCETLGPKTDLGKLLKGLKVAGEIAALTAILSMSEDDLVGLIREVANKLATVVGDVEQFLQPGGETVAGLIAHATADLT